MLAAVLMTGLLCLARAQLPPTVEGVTVIKSKLHDGVSISFKEVNLIALVHLFQIPSLM